MCVMTDEHDWTQVTGRVDSLTCFFPPPYPADARACTHIHTRTHNRAAPPTRRDCGASRLDTPCELLELSRGQLAGVQTMNNPLNRWIPWREVGPRLTAFDRA